MAGLPKAEQEQGTHFLGNKREVRSGMSNALNEYHSREYSNPAVTMGEKWKDES